MTYGEKLPYACGGIVVAGLLYLVLAVVIKVVGVKKVMHFLPPVVTGPIIICIGLSLAPSAVSNASANWFLALVALFVVIFFTIPPSLVAVGIKSKPIISAPPLKAT